MVNLRTTHVRRALLLGVPISLTLCVGLGLGLAMSYARASFGALHVERPPFDTFDDRPLGLNVRTIPVLDLALPGPLEESQTQLLVVAGACGSCSVNDISPSMIDWSKIDRVIVVYQSRELGTNSRPNLPSNRWLAVADPEGQAVARLNARWKPRYYLLNGRFELVKIQGRSESKYIFGAKHGEFVSRR